MADIKQTITIDTKSAIDSLANLENKLKQFSASLQAFGSNLSAVSRSIGGAGFREASSNISQLAQAFRKLNNTGKATGPALQTFAQATSEVGARGAAAAKIMDDFIASAQGTGQAVAQASNQAAGASNRFAQQFTAGFNSARSASINFGNIFKNVASSIVSSFKNIGRVIATQLIVSAFGSLRRAIAASVTDFIEFETRVREVETILPEVTTNADGLANSIRNLSDTFGLPLTQVTEGLYQTVSNQIGDAATSLRFLEVAAKFATVSVTSIDTSVNLLSGALQAFGKDVAETESIAAKFFRTIQLGRTRAKELEISFGRIAPIVEQTGGSLDELLAAFATITIAGVKTSEATTQLRGVLTAILKPTEEAAEVFRKAGFESGDLAFQALGLAGALDILKDAAGGSTSRFAELIPRVRGLNAALLLTSKRGVKLFEDNLRKITETTQEILDQKFEIIFESNAKIVERDINRLKNLFTQDLGGSLVSVFANVSKLTGGMGILIAALKALVTVFTPVVALIGLYSAALAIAHARTALLTSTVFNLGKAAGLLRLAMGPLGLALGLALAESFQSSRIQQQFKDLRREIDAFFAERIKKLETLTTKSLEIEEQLTTAIIRTKAKELIEINKGLIARTDARKEAIETEIKLEARLFKAVINARENILKKAQDDRDKQVELGRSAAENIIGLQAKLSDTQFGIQTRNLEGIQKIAALEQRARILARQGAEQLGKATSKDQADAARAILDRADALANETSSIASSLENRVASNQADQLGLGLIKTRITAEETLANATQNRVKSANAIIEQQKTELKRAKELVSLINEIKLFDKAGDPIAGAAKQRDALVREFGKLATLSDVVTLDQLIDVSKLGNNIDDILDKTQVKKLAVGEGAVNQLIKSIEADIAQVGVKIEPLVAQVEFLTGTRPEDIEDLIRALGELKNSFQDLTGEVDRRATDFETVRQTVSGAANSLANFKAINDEALGVAKGFARTIDSTALELTTFDTAVDKVVAAQETLIKQFAAGQKPSQAQIKNLQSLQKAAVDIAPRFGTETDLALLKSITDQLALATEQLTTAKEKASLSDALTIGGDAETQLARLGLFFANVGGFSGNVKQGFAAFSTSTDTADAKVKLLTSSLTTMANEFKTKGAEGVNALKAKINELPKSVTIPVALNVTETRTVITKKVEGSRGGKIRGFQAGGFANRGTDIIPAMLSPGEFVINAKSTRKFFSQLVAINSGRQPIFRQEGGPVSGATTFGDINVTVKSDSRNPDSTARNIARGLRRELRRNNFQF